MRVALPTPMLKNYPDEQQKPPVCTKFRPAQCLRRVANARSVASLLDGWRE
jgi:hypothetical protein